MATKQGRGGIWGRLGRLEASRASTSAGMPSWAEYMAAADRSRARAGLRFRSIVEGILEESGHTGGFDADMGKAMGVPGMWREERLAREAALLVGDSEEQRRQDELVIARWRKHNHVGPPESGALEWLQARIGAALDRLRGEPEPSEVTGERQGRGAANGN
jgi:hypothetical protein